MKKFVMALVASMLLVGPVLAQNNMGGAVNPQQQNTKITKTKIMKIGPDGMPHEEEVSLNENVPILRTNASGEYKYSGIPCKFRREKEGVGGQASSK